MPPDSCRDCCLPSLKRAFDDSLFSQLTLLRTQPLSLLSPAASFTCLLLFLEVNLLPSWDAGCLPSLSYCSEVRQKIKLLLSQKIPIPHPVNLFLSSLVLYLVLVGRIKGDLCHLGAFLPHLLHGAVGQLNELDEGRLRSVPCCYPLPEGGFVYKRWDKERG